MRPPSATDAVRGSPSKPFCRETSRRIFKEFCSSTDLSGTVKLFQELISSLHIPVGASTDFPEFTIALQKKLKFYTRAKQFFDTVLTEKSNLGYLKDNGNGELILTSNKCRGRKVLVVGSGPSGLRMAIEARMLGAHVVLLERRQAFSRKNILYLWDYVVNDMKSLSCKTFCGEFCSGSRQIIAIQKLQLILLKIALLLGVKFYYNVTLKSLRKPPSSGNEGWRANLIPTDHPVSTFEFDFFVDATGILGRQDTDTSFNFDNPMADGFLRHRVKAMGGLKKASRTFIAVAANFEMHPTADISIKDFGGISDVYKDNTSKLDLSKIVDENGDKYEIENLTYYKEDTHYFLMTISEESLLKRKVLKVGGSDSTRATNPENVSFERLEKMVLRIVDQVTEGKLKNRQLCFVKAGKKDLTVFGYVAQVFASASCRVLERNGKRLFMALVGDSLIKPHWPSGNGIVKGFFSAMDTCHVLRQWSTNLSKKEIKDLIKEKEKHFCCLKSINAGKHINKRQTYTGTDPKRRYTDLYERILPYLAKLYDTDCLTTVDSEKGISVVGASDVGPTPEPPKKDEFVNGSEEVYPPSNNNESLVPARAVPKEGRIPADLVLFWYSSQLKQLDIDVTDFTTSWHSGMALWGLISMCEEGYLDMAEFKKDEPVLNNQRALGVLSHFFGVTPTLSAEEISTCSEKDEPAMIEYLSSVLLRLKRTYVEVMPVPPDVPTIDGPKEELQRESEDLLGGLMRACYSAVKWKHRTKPLNRSGSLPSVVPDFKLDEVCTVCKTEIFCRDYGLREMGHSVHQHCFKCSSCDDHLISSKYVFDSVDKKFCCSDCHKRARIHSSKEKFSSASPREPLEEYARRWFEEHAMDSETSSVKTNADVPVEHILPNSESRISTKSETLWYKCLEDSKTCQKTETNSRSIPRKGNVASIIKKFGALFSPDTSRVKLQEPPPLHKSASCPQLVKTLEMVVCHFCWKHVYMTERMNICKRSFHRHCFKCETCGIRLTLKTFVYDNKSGSFSCIPHGRKPGDLEKWIVPEVVGNNIDVQLQQNSVSNTSPTYKFTKMTRRVSAIFRVKTDEADDKTVTRL